MPTNPRGNPFWNPYRWVPANPEPVRHAVPHYHHRWQGAAGRLDCTLEALTPLLINDNGQFLRGGRSNKPFIPGTSLKGVIRALAELIGNAAQPFPDEKIDIDNNHRLADATSDDRAGWQLDSAARMFGYLGPGKGKNQGKVFNGLVRFSDAQLIGNAPPVLTCSVAGGTPDPKHRPFYPGNNFRKFYHHNVGATTLTPPDDSIPAKSRRTVHPLPPGVKFTFRVEFANLREEELNLLLYCLALEEEVNVTLSKEALGSGEPVPLRGPMRHKIGSCKPQGGGSVEITVRKMEVRSDPAARYRGAGTAAPALEGDDLRAEITRRSQLFIARTDLTMLHVRAMMLYAAGDPRSRNLHYPSYNWFLAERAEGTGTLLKPTL